MTLTISLKDRLRLKRLQKEQQDFRSRHDRLISKAREDALKNGKGQRDTFKNLAPLREQKAFDLLCIKDEINRQITNSLLREVQRLFITMPFQYDDKEMWKMTETTAENVLTEKGISLLKEAIRKECSEISKQNEQRRDAWLPWIVAISGLIGMTTGLLAVIFNFLK